jgi:hypothetical protein
MAELAANRIYGSEATADVFDSSTPFGYIASSFFKDRLDDWRANRLRFPEELTPDQYEDWLLGCAVTTACYATRMVGGTLEGEL